MLHVRDIYMCDRRMVVGNGYRTSFWVMLGVDTHPSRTNSLKSMISAMNGIYLWLLLLR
jgi:hypothetical protein